MNDQRSPRWLNILVGIWLFVSAFLWPHSSGQFTNSLVVGALCVVSAAIAVKAPPFRAVNILLALWLFCSTWGFPVESRGTLWNNAIAAIVMLIIALVPSTTPRLAHH